MIPTPSPQQLRFADMELGAFYHFSMSTYTGRPHETGRASPEMFNPVNLDARQWLSAAKAIGAKYAVLTSRHEDGFCLWPTETTEYCVRNAPWKDGKGDVVQEFVEACEEADIRLGLYLSPGFNGHHLFKPEDDPDWGDWDSYWEQRTDEEFEAFKALEIAQAVELVTTYKPFYLWCDHNLGGTPGDRFHEVTRAATQAVIEADPELLVLGPHVWVTGNELGHTTYPLWNAVNTVDDTLFTRPRATGKNQDTSDQFGLLETDVHTGHPLGKYWRMVEAVTDKPFGTGRWFYKEDRIHDNDGDEVLDTFYLRTVGFGSNLMINFSPAPDGLLPEEHTNGARKFGEAMQRRFGQPIARTEKVMSGDTVELSWEQSQEIRYVEIMENIVNGQKVASYTLEAWVDGAWQELTPDNPAGYLQEAPAGFETIGHKKIDVVVPVNTQKVRFRCLNAVQEPVEIRSLAVFGQATPSH